MSRAAVLLPQPQRICWPAALDTVMTKLQGRAAGCSRLSMINSQGRQLKKKKKSLIMAVKPLHERPETKRNQDRGGRERRWPRSLEGPCQVVGWTQVCKAVFAFFYSCASTVNFPHDYSVHVVWKCLCKITMFLAFTIHDEFPTGQNNNPKRNRVEILRWHKEERGGCMKSEQTTGQRHKSPEGNWIRIPNPRSLLKGHIYTYGPTNLNITQDQQV